MPSLATFQAVRKELGSAEHPAHYLAIPPMLFEEVVEQLREIWLRKRRPRRDRKAIRPRFGFCPGTQPHTSVSFPRVFDFSHRPLSRQTASPQHGDLPLLERFHGTFLESQLRRQRADHHGREFRRAGPGRVLRPDWRDSRRYPESSVSGALQSGDGASCAF